MKNFKIDMYLHYYLLTIMINYFISFNDLGQMAGNTNLHKSSRKNSTY